MFDLFVFLLNVAVGWCLSAYILQVTDWVPPRFFLGGVIVGVILFFLFWWVVVGAALGVFIGSRLQARA